jgi:hypothetical protein
MAEIVGLCPVWIQAQYFDNYGNPLSGGLIYTYADNVDENVPTWTDRTGTVENTNPIVLDSSGRMHTSIWLRAGAYYTLVLNTANGNELARTRGVTTQKLIAGDNITLDPPGGVGGSVIVTAAGPYDGTDNGRGPSQMYQLEQYNISIDGMPYSDWSSWMQVGPTTPEVDYDPGLGAFQCQVAGAYSFQVTAKIGFTETSDPWPDATSVFGFQLAYNNGELIDQSSHTRFSSVPFDGLPP